MLTRWNTFQPTTAMAIAATAAMTRGRIAAHVLEGDADRRLQRHGAVRAFALEAFDGELFVKAQGLGIGANIADGEDTRRQGREVAFLQRDQIAGVDAGDDRQLGQRTARGLAGRAQAFAQSRCIDDGGHRVLPVRM
jgi:hypothetical protein